MEVMMAIAYLLQVVESSAFVQGHADVELLLEMLFFAEGSRKENP